MDQLTFQIISGYNPWLLDPAKWKEVISNHIPPVFINRRSLVEDPFTSGKVLIIVGPRQAGKSTLIWSFLKQSKKPFLLLNCEEPSIRAICSSPSLFLNEIKQLCGKLPGIFFEEIQHLDEAGLFLKGLVDLKPDVPIFATGSASYHLKSKTRESLAGRALRQTLYPFSFSEVYPHNMSTLVDLEKASHTWNDLLIWGSYPEVYLNQNKPLILAQLVEAFVLRDASDLYRITRPEAFRKLLSLAASQIGNLVNYSNLAENLGISVNSVKEYLNILTENHLVKLVPPFVGGKRAEITSVPKLYFLDNGLRNFLFGGFGSLDQRSDAGALYENLAFTEIIKQINPLLDKLYYWRSSSGAEVDFILQTRNHLAVIEIKAGIMKHPKVSRSLRSFLQVYQPKYTVVYNASLEDTVIIEGCKVRFERHVKLPGNISKLL